MRGILALIQPWNPLLGARETIRLGSASNGLTTGLAGYDWETGPFARRPRLSMEFLDDELSGRLMTGRGDLGLNVSQIKGSASPKALRWIGAPITVWSGDGPEFSDMKVEFVGTVRNGTPDRETEALTISFEVDRTRVDVPLLNLEYTGGGGSSGDVELRGQLKPAGFGTVRNLPPIMINVVNNVFQFDGYANAVSVQGVFEDLADMGASVGDYANYAALVAAAIPNGRWATCLAEGLIRLGAPPTGKITMDATFGSGQPGSMCLRWLQTHAGLAGGLIRTSDFNALTSAVQALLGGVPSMGYWTQSADNVLDLVQKMCASCNAVPLLMLDGTIGVSRIFGGAQALELRRQNGDPMVTAWQTMDSPVPWWRMKMAAARVYYVNSPNEIDFEDDIIDLGDYDNTYTYRIGNVIRNPVDGIRYLYINATPSSGHAPPNVTYWDVYEDRAQGRIWPPSPTPPATPKDSDLWPDTSTTPPTLRRYLLSTTSWIVVANTVTQGTDIGVANGAGTTLNLYAVGSVPGAISGNQMISAVGGYGTCVRGDAFGDVGYAEMDISAGYTMVALDLESTGDHFSVQTVTAHLYATAGILAVYVDNVVAVNVSGGSFPSSGKLRIVYDGFRYRIFVAGVEYGASAANLKAAGPNLIHFPKFWAYTTGVTYTGIAVGTFADRSGLLPGWTGIGATVEIIGDRFRKTGGAHSSYDAAIVGPALKWGGYVSANVYRAGSGGGWYTQVALDDDNTSFAFASQKFVLDAYDDVSTTQFTVRLYKDGALVAGPVVVPVTAGQNYRLTLAYDGVRMIGMVNGVPIAGMTYSTGVPEAATYYPKVLSWQQQILDTAGPKWVTGLDYGFFTNNSFGSIGGAGRPANNAGTAVILAPANPAVAANIAIQGNTVSQDGANGSYNYAVGSAPLYGACYVEQDIYSAGWSFVALDNSQAQYAANDQSAYGYYHGPTGQYAIIYNATPMMSGTTTAGLTGKIALVFDGVNVRLFVAGQQLGPAVLSTPDFTGGGAIYPKWWPYHINVQITGLQAGYFTDNNWASVGGAGRPSDNAGTSGLLTAIGAGSIIQGNSVYKKTATDGAYDGGAVGAAQFGTAFITSTIIFPLSGAGYQSILALDDDATSFSHAGNKYLFRLIALGSGTYQFDLYLNGGLVANGTTSGLTANSRMSLVYDGTAVYAIVDGGIVATLPGQAASQKLFPKVLDYYYNSADARRDILHGPWSENAWSRIGGAGRPSDNAGTSGTLTTIGSGSQVVGNTVYKDGGTHGGQEGGAVGRPQFGTCYISASIINPTAGGGWYSVLSLDDDATNFTLATQKYQLQVIPFTSTSVSWYLQLNNVTIASGTANLNLTLNSRMAIVYDGSIVYGIVDGFVLGTIPNQAASQTLYPKVIDFHQNTASNPRYDIQHGPWSENAWQRITGAGKPADNAGTSINLVSVDTSITTITGNGADRITGSGWTGGFNTLESHLGAVVANWPIVDNAGGYIVGFNDAPITNAANNWNQVDYAVQQDGVNIHVYTNGSYYGFMGTVAQGDQLTVFSDNSMITLIRTTPAGVVTTLHSVAVLSVNRRYFLCGTFNGVGAKVRGLRFEPFFDRLIDNTVDSANYARVAAGELTSNLIKLGIAGSGKQLGDQRNLRAITAMNLGYKFTGTISYSATAGTPATATISVGAGDALIGSVSVSYGARSVGVTGTNGTIVDYFLYSDDGAFAGGSPTLIATTVGNDIFGNNNRVWFGVCSVSYPASGGGSGGGGGGGGYCVAAGSFLPGHGRARSIRPGDAIVVLDTNSLDDFLTAPVTGNDEAVENCVEIRTVTGIRLICSESTPVTYRDGSVDSVLGCAGRELPVLDRGKFGWAVIATVTPVGRRRVARIHVGGATYAAGAERDRFIFTHNPNNPKP